MPIIHNTHSTTLTGDAISFYRLAAMKGAVGLELKGIRMTRHSVTAQAKRELGLKGNKQAVYDQLCKLVEDAAAQQEHVTVDGKRLVNGQEVQ